MHYAASMLYGMAVSVLTAIVLGFVNRGLDHHSGVAALCAGVLAVLAGALHARRQQPGASRPRGWEWFPVVLFALFAARAFLWLVFRETDDLAVLSPNNLGDLSLHLTYIEYLANGAPFWPDNPIFANGKLGYALGVDLFNSLLTLAGVDTLRGLLWVGLAGAAFTAFALWQWGRGFALLGFLCAGGLLGLAAFTPGEPFFQDYPGLLKFDWAWKNPALALLVTQRGFLFAFPAGLLLLASWRGRFLDDGSGWRLPIAGEILLYAAMPAFHLHTFLALSFVLACWFLARAGSRKKIAALVVAAFLPATALVYLAIGMFQANALPDWGDMSQFEDLPRRSASDVLGWQPGWMVNDRLDRFDPWALLTEDIPAAQPWTAHGRFAQFWLGNFGFLPIFAVALAWVLLRRLLKIRAIWGLLALTAFLFVTPLLGQFRGYQTESLHGWLLGEAVSDVIANLTLWIAAAILLATWIGLRKRGQYPVLQGIVLFLAVALGIDGLLASLHAAFPRVPLLRANALPLLAATAPFLAVLWKLRHDKSDDARATALLLSGLYLFFLCCNVLFAPSAWDNTKLMIWAYLLVLPPLWENLLRRWPIWLRGAALVALFFSGFVTLLGGINNQYRGYPIATLSELDELREATKNIPITETFAAEPTYNHPLLLIGRKLVLGYPAHLWSHGVESTEQQQRLDALMNGEPDWRMQAARLGARYLFFGKRESALWPESAQPWRDGAKLVAEGRDWALFDLETPAVPIP